MLTPKIGDKPISTIEIDTIYGKPAAAWKLIDWLLKRPTAEGGLKKFSLQDIQESKEGTKAPENPYLETKEDYDAAIAASTEKPLIIDFTATWCPPCKMIGPIFEGYMEKTKGKLTLKKLDVDANSKASQAAGISAMPTFKVYKDGAEVEKLQGADPNKLKEMVERFGNLSLDGDADDDDKEDNQNSNQLCYNKLFDRNLFAPFA